MGSERRFTLGLLAWVLALALALAATLAAFANPDLSAARIAAAGLSIGAVAGLWHHVRRTNLAVTRFVEALQFGDTAARFDSGSGAGFGALSKALNDAMARVRERQDAAIGEQRFLEALVDDMPVALLTVAHDGQVRPANKAARRLFQGVEGARPEDYAAFSATFAKRLADGGPSEELLLLAINGHAQNVLLRSASLDRLGRPTRAVTVQPIQGTLNAVVMAAQTDLVRVLTHEILNSLTPVTSLAESAASLLQDSDLGSEPRVVDARAAVTALARRATGLSHFIEAYRAVARPPTVQRRLFAAEPWAAELLQLFRADHAGVPVTLEVEPAGLALDADPDLMAQVVLNLLQNAHQAMEGRTAHPQIQLRLYEQAGEILLDVEDNGPGVPMSLRQDIFLPFFTTRPTGTGVGLNLARQVAVAHGGTIEVVDGANGGALVRIRL